MNCFCENCEGTGKVECEECLGRGEWESSIGTAYLDRNTAGFDELLALQNDVKRVKQQAERLIALKPERKASYEAQLEATIEEIDRQADTVAEKAKNPKKWPWRR